MNVFIKVALATALASMLSSCVSNGSDDDIDDDSFQSLGQEICRDIAEASCTSISDCGAGDLTQCKVDVSSSCCDEIDCRETYQYDRPREDFDECLDDLRDRSCDDLDRIPRSCDGF
jgi:hypothetical protein